MKREIIAIMALFVLLFGIPMASASFPNNFALKVTMVNQEPDPVNPDSYVDVRFKIENLGTSEAQDVKFEIEPEFPFSLEPGDSAVKDLGTLQSRQMDDKAVIVKYRLLVDKNAIEGDNQIKVRYQVKDFGYAELEPFLISVRTPETIVSVDSISSEPQMIKPGSDAKLSIKLTNIADSQVKDVKVNLDLTSVPLAPSGSTNEITIKNMDAGETKDFVFTLAAKPNADSAVYTIPMKITYKDNLGNPYTINNIISAKVGDTPDLIIDLENTDIFKSDMKGTVSVQFVNKGVTGVKFVFVKLNPSDQYEIIGLDEAYVGNINSDDYQTTDFKIYVKPSNARQDVVLPISIEYRDANNNIYKVEKELTIRVFSDDEAKKMGLITKDGTLGIIITLVIIAVGVIVYLRWRKGSKKKKE